jgi:DNA adenine methylase
MSREALGEARAEQAALSVKPFLKWAGGKRQLLPSLRPFYPARFGAYFEPFLGSGAVFFDLHSRGLLDGHDVLLSDSSVDLIACYSAVRDRVEEVIEELEGLEAGHRSDAPRHYYAVRDARFNPLRRELRDRRVASPDTDGSSALHVEASHVTLAAMLIYLNRTGYNGLFRVNASGDFNVPIGRYERPRICDGPGLRKASAALRAAGVRLKVAAYSDALAEAREGDFVYLDPPYAPLTRTARFTAYTAAGFDSAAQQQLRQAVIGLAKRGVRVLLSNSAADEVRSLYADDPGVRRAGLRTHLVPARRAINSRGGRRGPVYEYVITNGVLN